MSYQTPAIEGGIPVRERFLSFSEPDVQEQDIQAAVDVIRSGWLSTGKKAWELELAFKNYKKVDQDPYHEHGGALATSSCTAALHLAILACIAPGDEVLVPDYTFSATVATVLHAGGIPVLVDCDRFTQNISVTDLQKKVTSKTRALVIVHFAGLPCDMLAIEEFCDSHNIRLIEDCAHAIETKAYGKPAGTWGMAGCFSFYGTKNITTAVGEGGMLLTNFTSILDEVRTRSLHGMSKNASDRYGSNGFKHYDILYPGFKYNMPDVSAAFALSQFSRIEDSWAKRKAIWNSYKLMLADLPINLPVEVMHHSDKHAYHLFTIQLQDGRFSVPRDRILDALTKEGIGVGVHYTAIHNHTYWKESLGVKPEDFPEAHWLSENTISLPLTPKLTQEDIQDVIAATRKVLTYYGT